MKVAGFTFIKDAIRYDYPIVEAIQSILPLCDEVVVAVGKSSDGTLELIQSINSSKIRIIETIWDESLREGGRVLATETDKAYKAISNDVDWAIYIQGDEVMHEDGYSVVRKAMETYQNVKDVEGLLFDYLHFYGSYDYIATASTFYTKEIRVIKRRDDFFSYKDAQGFRKMPNEKLNVIKVDAKIHHYGWVKPPASMQAKQLNFNKYWHDDEWINEHIAIADEYDFSKISSLSRFHGNHPKVITQRIHQTNWKFEYDLSKSKISFKDLFKTCMLKWFGWNLNYQNYKIIRRA